MRPWWCGAPPADLLCSDVGGPAPPGETVTARSGLGTSPVRTRDSGGTRGPSRCCTCRELCPNGSSLRLVPSLLLKQPRQLSPLPGSPPRLSTAQRSSQPQSPGAAGSSHPTSLPDVSPAGCSTPGRPALRVGACARAPHFTVTRAGRAPPRGELLPDTCPRKWPLSGEREPTKA